tara:strand:- start:90598 stop:92355 length:1758 start_codon:yes stop_codon:yes gene_type:complete
MASSSAQSAQIKNIRVGHHSDQTRLVFDVSAPVQYSVQTITNPPQVVIEIAAVDSTRPRQPELAGTPINSMKMVTTEGGGLRVELPLSAQATVRSFVLLPEQDRGDRLVIDIFPGASKTVEQAGISATVAAATVSPAATQHAQRPSRVASAGTSPREALSKSASQTHDNSGAQFSFSGTWEQEWAYQTKNTGNQKFEALVKPRMDVDFSSGAHMVAIGRIRLDAVGDLGPFENRPDNYSDINGPFYNDEYAEISLRELYLDTQWAGAYWRLGKQQVVWGQADGIKVLDVVNPQSFREFILDDFDDSRIPLWMVNAEIPLDTGSLQLLWIPDTTYHELAEAGTPYFLTSPKWVPQPAPGQSVKVASTDKPDNMLNDSDAGVRYSTFLGGWDITLNYLYHYQDYPVLYQQEKAGNVLQIDPVYKRNNLFGTTLSNAFDSVTLRTEIAYSTDVYHISQSPAQRGVRNSDEIGSVIGLDWQYSGDGLLSTQWFYSYIPDYNQDIVRGKSENMASLLLQQNFANEAWQLRMLAIYSLDDEDSLLELKLKYWLLGNLEVWLGGDFFHGTQSGNFGQFDQQSRALIGFEYGF